MFVVAVHYYPQYCTNISVINQSIIDGCEHFNVADEIQMDLNVPVIPDRSGNNFDVASGSRTKFNIPSGSGIDLNVAYDDRDYTDWPGIVRHRSRSPPH